MKYTTSMFFTICIMVLSFGAHAQDIEHRAFVFHEDDSCTYESEATGFLLGSAQVVGVYAGGPFPGNGKMTCKGTHDLSLESPLVIRDDACFAFGFPTDDTLFIATPGGRWSFFCNFPKAE